MHHKRRSRSKRLRLYPKMMLPWYVPLVAKGKQVKERRIDRSEREQRAEVTSSDG